MLRTVIPEAKKTLMLIHIKAIPRSIQEALPMHRTIVSLLGVLIILNKLDLLLLLQTTWGRGTQRLL